MILKWNSYEILNESLQKARSILRRLNINEDDKRFVELRELLRRNPGYLGKFTEWLFVGKQTINNLESLYDRIKGVRLSKPIDEFKTVEDVIDSLVRDSSSTAVNQMINAIPSRTREYLKSAGEKCMQCDGDKVLACDECNHGDVKCDCIKVGKNRRKETDKNCKKCGGSGRYDCKKCDGEGEIPCTYCNKSDGSEGWKELLAFLSLQREKKDLIISFFSKKGGRYGEDEDYYDYDNYDSEDDNESNVIDRIIEDLKKILDIMDIESLKKSIEDSDDAKVLHDDDQYLIIAVNYRGIRKYGSSYWCIYESESTFDDYVYECGENSINFQLIAYNKKLVPFVDDESVIGITINIIKDEVTAAHYEDDSDCSRFAEKMLSKIKFERSAILNAISIYNKNLYDEYALVTAFPENYIKEIDSIIDNDYYLDQMLCDSSVDFTPIFINILKERLTIKNCKFKVSETESLIRGFQLGLVKFLNIDGFAKRSNIFRLMSSNDISVKDSIEIIKTYISAGYTPRLDEYSLQYIGPCIRNSIFKLEDIYRSIGYNGEWSDIISVVSKSKLSTFFKYILKNDFNFIKERFLKEIVIWLSSNNAELNKYVDKFIESIESKKYNKEEIDWLLEFLDDDEIDRAIYKSLFSRNARISKKWDIDMKRKVTERLKSYYEFNKVNENFDEDGIVKIETDEDFLKYYGNEFFPISESETESINMFLKSELPRYRVLTPNYGKKCRNNIIPVSVLDRIDKKFNNSEIVAINFSKTVGFNYKININTTTELSTFVAKDMNDLLSFLKKILS